MKNTEIFIDWMTKNGYVADHTRERPRGGGGGRKPQEAPKVVVNGKGVEVKCPKCEGPVWDNRIENDKREANNQSRRPDFACRDKASCQWIAWNASDVERELTPVEGQPDYDAVPFE